MQKNFQASKTGFDPEAQPGRVPGKTMMVDRGFWPDLTPAEKRKIQSESAFSVVGRAFNKACKLVGPATICAAVVFSGDKRHKGLPQAPAQRRRRRLRFLLLC